MRHQEQEIHCGDGGGRACARPWNITARPFSAFPRCVRSRIGSVGHVRATPVGPGRCKGLPGCGGKKVPGRLPVPREPHAAHDRRASSSSESRRVMVISPAMPAVSLSESIRATSASSPAPLTCGFAGLPALGLGAESAASLVPAIWCEENPATQAPSLSDPFSHRPLTSADQCID